MIPIVLIVVDDPGFGDFSPDRTPAITEFAAEATTFTRFYAYQSCAPTRASLMTGWEAPRTFVYQVGRMNRASDPGSTAIDPPPFHRNGVLRSANTLPERLQNRGYFTAHVGKYHVDVGATDELLTAYGFDVQCGADEDDGAPGSYYTGLVDGAWRFGENIGPCLDAGATGQTHLTDAEADAAIEILRAHAAGDAPVFLHLGFHAVHTPIEPDPSIDLPAYEALLWGVDRAIGRVLEHVPEGALTVIMGDNGGVRTHADMGGLPGGKGEFREGGIRTPLLIRGPGFERGVVDDRLVHVSDLIDLFVGGELPERSSVCYHFPGYYFELVRPLSQIITADRKLVYDYETGGYTLTDADESASLPLCEEAGLSAELGAWLETNVPENGYGVWRATGEPVSPPERVLIPAALAQPVCEFNIDDVLGFLAGFSLRSPAADYAHPRGEFDIDDVLGFLEAVAEGG